MQKKVTQETKTTELNIHPEFASMIKDAADQPATTYTSKEYFEWLRSLKPSKGN